MFSRRQRQVLLLVGLIALNALLAWQEVRLWKRYGERSEWVYAAPAEEPAGAAASSARPPAEPPSFADIVDHNLFQPDRGKVVAREEVPAPNPPVLYGTMDLGTRRFALMAPADQAESGAFKRVYPGEEIGGYKLVSIAGSEVVVEHGQRKLTLNVADSARQSTRRTEKTSGSARAPSITRTPSNVVGSSRPAQSSAPASAREAERKKFSPAGYNAPPGAPVDAPAGTVFGGKRKVVRETPFGNQVWWVDVEKPEPPPAKPETEKKETEKKDN